MSTFDAGKIMASFDVDLTPFEAGLAQAKRKGEEFARQRYTATLDFDTSRAEQRLARMRSQLARSANRYDVDTSAADRALNDLQGKLNNTSRVAQKAGQDAKTSFKPLFDSIVLAGPALVPLAGGLAGLSFSLLGIGTTGLLAFKGINAEIKAGTPLGQQYHAGLAVLQSDLQGLERTAAAGVLKPFEQGVDALNNKVPQLNKFIAQTSGVTGDIGAHLLGGFVNLLTAAEPLILTAEKDVDGLARRFEAWSAGPGGAKFFATLQQDIPPTIQFIGTLGTAIVHVVEAVAPLGSVALGVFTGIGKALGAIPVPVLTAIASGLIVWRLNALLAAGAENVLAAATERAAAAGIAQEGVSARIGAGILGLARTLTVGSIAFSTLKAATQGWDAKDPRSVGGFLEQTTHVAGVLGADVFNPFRWSKLAGDVKQSVRDIRGAISIGDLQKQINAYFVTANQASASEQVLLSNMSLAQATAYRNFKLATDAGLQYALQNQQRVQGFLRATNTNLASGNLSAAPQGIQDATASIQKMIDAEQKWTDATGKTIQVQGLGRVSVQAWAAAFSQANGDIGVAIQILQGHRAALIDDQDALAKLNAENVNANKFLSDVAIKYGLNTQQVDMYTSALGLNNAILNTNGVGLAKLEDYLGRVKDRLDQASPSLQSWLDYTSKLDTSTDTLTQRVGLLGAGLTALIGNTLTAATTNLTAVDATEKLSTAIHDNAKSVGLNGQLLGQLTQTAHGWVVTQPRLTAGSLQIAQAMSQASQQGIQLAQSIYANTGNANLALTAYSGLRDQFISTARQMGLTKGQAYGLANQIFAIPKDAKTFVALLNKDNVTKAIQDLTVQLANLNKILSVPKVNLGGNALNKADELYKLLVGPLSGDYTANVNVNSPAGPGGGVQLPGVHAAGGQITGGIPGVDSVPALLMPEEYVIRAPVVRKYGAAFFDNINKGTAPFRIAADGRAHMADGGYVPPSLYIPGTGSSGTAGTATHSQLNSIITALERELNRLGQLAKSTPAAIQSALNTLYSTLQQANRYKLIPNAMLAQISGENKQLVAEVNLRNTYASKLAAANTALKNVNQQISQETATVRSAIMGGFDIGTSGSGYAVGIEATLQKQLSDAEKFAALRKQAKALGLNPALLQQITEEGPATAGKNLQAIVGAGADYVKRINSEYAQLGSTATQIGAAQAQDIYGKQQAKDIADVRKYTKLSNDEQKLINKNLQRLISQLQRLDRDLVAAARQG